MPLNAARRTRWVIFPAVVVLVALIALPVADSSPTLAAGAGIDNRALSTDGVVIDGAARFQVLSPTLIRAEYADDGRFEDRPTYNAVNRSVSPPPFTTGEENGQLVIRTDKLTLMYHRGSGAFTPDNLSVRLDAGAQHVTARPSWSLAGECEYETLCEAELMRLSDGEEVSTDNGGYTGRGYATDGGSGGGVVGWTQRQLPSAGRYAVQFRYASAPLNNEPQTVILTVAGQTQELKLEPTGRWDSWATEHATVELPAGDSDISVACPPGHPCDVNLDSVAVTTPNAPYPPPVDPAHASSNLGGWRRSLDEASGPRPLFDGLLSRDGWYLLNDTETAVVRPDGTVEPRPAHPGSAYQDGYVFGYGHDYKQGLRDLHSLTGPPPMLPRWALGNWFSRYYPYTDADYRDSVLPAFRADQVPLDVLVVDTDFKSPNTWNGWMWDPHSFPDPAGFLAWAHAQGVKVSLNVHPSITTKDPRYAQIKAQLGRDLAVGDCVLPDECRVFNFSDPAELRAYFDLHEPFERQGLDNWWLDSCCDPSRAQPNGISPDSYINAQYAQRADRLGRRGFSWNRSGSGYTGYGETAVYPAGPWADHRSTVDTSMDTVSTWDMLSFEAYYTVRRGNIGMPYESHDIGGHNYDDDDNKLPDDLYARWVQFGTFQPVLRLHSNHGHRLPWEYDSSGREAAETFLRLREALIPYTYSLARAAYDTGLPMARGLYLNYPQYDEAYRYDRQYLFGDDVLVAPVTRPGNSDVATKVWFPPGTWVDYFTGRRYTGPGVETVTTSLRTMPVFLRAGGILPTRTDYVDSAGQKPLDQVTLDVATGGAGSFSLYEDAGEGLAYRAGELGRTAIQYAEAPESRTGTVTVAPREGDFPGSVVDRAWTVRFRDIHRPGKVTIDGATLGQSTAGPGWSYDSRDRTLTVRTAKRATRVGTVIAVTAG